MQLFPMSLANEYPLAQVMPVVSEPLLQRRVVGVPMWGWGLGVVSAAGLAYWFFGRSKVTANPEAADTEDLPALPSSWQPSRSGFGERLKVCLQKCGVAEQTTIYIDADDAQKKLVQVSPLVTIQCKTKPPMKDLEKLAKREGLTAVEHDKGVVGFYPGTGKKGKTWEGYVDSLRDDGQKV